MHTKEIVLYKPKEHLQLMPRERLLKNGASSLGDVELFAVILGSGIKGVSVQKISKCIVNLIDEKKDKIQLSDLMKIDGLGQAKSLAILATIEIGRRIYVPYKRKIQSPDDALPILFHYADRQQEHFIVIALNGANEVVSSDVISVGLLNKTLVHPREVFRNAIRYCAASVIVAHNHPSGNVEPSKEDIEVTQHLIDAGKVVDIRLIDHIVFSSKEHYSFLGNNLI